MRAARRLSTESESSFVRHVHFSPFKFYHTMFTEYCYVHHSQLDWLMTNVYVTTLASLILLIIKVSIILPVLVFLLIYINAVLIVVCGYICGLKDPSPENKSWRTIMYVSTRFWQLLGRFWHGHEFENMENVPSKGPALLVYYHGAVAFESYMLYSDFYVSRKRMMSYVVDNCLNYLPGWATGLKLFRLTSASFEQCIKFLNEGHLVTISPGGMYECQFSDSNYGLEWRNRLGYAKVAIQAKVPIVPFFTVNIREAYRGVNVGNKFFEKLYLKWRFPFKPFYGGYPVKLRTIFGEPIPYDPMLTAEQLDKKVRMAMEQLIKDNQRLPGSIAMALLDRIYCPKKTKKT